MKQKYFVLLFLNFLLINTVFSQNYSNYSELKIEAGTDFTIGNGEGTHKFINFSGGEITNEGVVNASSEFFRNDGICLNDGTVSIGVYENNLTTTNNSSFNVTTDLKNFSAGTVTNDGVITVDGNYENNNITINDESGIIEVGTHFLNNATGDFTNSNLLFVQGDYMNNGVIDQSDGITTFNQTSPVIETIQNIYGNSDFEFNNLVVDNNTSLGVLVADGIGLVVTNELDLREGLLRLDGESQLIQPTGSSLNTDGTGLLLRDQQGIASTYGYNFWSSPVNNGSGSYSLDNVLFDGTDSSVNPFSPMPIQYTTGSGGNGSPSIVDGSGNVTTAATINALTLFSFINGDINDGDDWIKINESTLLLSGEGYTMKGTNTLDSNQNYTFRGKPNNGPYEMTVSGSFKSNLLGNPYPSAISSDLLMGSNFFTVPGLYFWVDGGSVNHTQGDYVGGYATRTIGVGAPASVVPGIAGPGDSASAGMPGEFMAVGQGFFIETGNLFFPSPVYFNNSMRVFVTEDDPLESIFFKGLKKEELAQKEDLSKKSIIRIGYEDPEGFHRQIPLAFFPEEPNANLNFNTGYDGKMIAPREDELYFIIENDISTKFVIQVVGSFNEDAAFPVGLEIAEEGVHTIMLDAVENFDRPIYIFDKVLGVTYNISEEPFIPNLGIGTYNNRFEIVFKPQSSLGTDDESISNFNVYFDGNQNLIVKNKSGIELKKLSVFNTLGQQLLVLNNSKLERSESVIPFSYQMGVYVVVVESNEGKETFRIINK